MTHEPSTILADLTFQGYSCIEETTESEMWALANFLGIPQSESRDGQVIKLVRPQPESLSHPNTLSSRYGTGSFPFHTDAAYWHSPLRYLLLRCINPGEGGRPTLLVDSHSCITADEWDLLRNSVCIVAGRRSFLSPIAKSCAGHGNMVRFDKDCMKANSRAAEEALAIVFAKTTGDNTTEINWRSNSLLIVDNYRMLHARGSSRLPDPERLHQKILVAEVEDVPAGRAQSMGFRTVLA